MSHVIYLVPHGELSRVEHTYSGHARDSHAWNMCGHKRTINIRYSPAINSQKHVDSSQL